MAGFFQQLIDLGEEKPTVTAKNDQTDEEFMRMTKDELIKELRKLQQTLAEKESERKQVQEEALANQTKHEAYRKNVDMWQQQMKELRAADKKMIDELRAAGATGKIDDAYVKSTNETIEGLKQNLKEARDDAAKAYKRQREAEEMRAEFEKSSKHEYQELFNKFDAFRIRSKQSTERLEQQVLNLTDDNGNLRERLQMVNDQLKEQQKQIVSQQQHENSIGAGGAHNTNSSSSTDAVAALRAQLEEANKRISHLQQQQQQQGGGSGANSVHNTPSKAGGWAVDDDLDIINGGDEEKTDTTAAAASTGGSSKPSSPLNNAALSAATEKIHTLTAQIADLTAANEALTNDITTTKIQLAAAVSKEQETELKLRKSEDRLQRIEQDLDWEKVEADKKTAEIKSSVESGKAKIQQAEAKLEAKEEEIRATERSHKRVVRDLEDAIAAEKDKYALLLRKSEEKEQFLEEQIQHEREKVAANSDKAGEAEQTSKRTSEALESQRMHFEIQIGQRDTRIQELYGVKQALEASLQDAKDDVRRLEDAILELRHEINGKEELLRESEASQSELQRALVAREEDLQCREKERQNLRTRLRDEEDRGIELHAVLRELELRLTEMDVENKRKEAQRTFTDAEITRLQATIESLHETTQSQATLLHLKENQLGDTTRRLQDQGMRNADIVRLREDQISAIRAYEKKINDLEKQVAIAQSNAISNAAAAAAGGGGANGRGGGGGTPASNPLGKHTHGLEMPSLVGGYANQLERRQQMLSEAFASAKRSAGLGNLSGQQVKMVLIGAVVLIVFISIINGLRSLSAAGVGTQEFDSLSIVREKYAQALASLTTCQEQLVVANKGAAPN